MVTRQIAFVCDMCGRQFCISERDYEALLADSGNQNADPLPDGWRNMNPYYGHVCTKCCEELDGVYARIHAPYKAREEAYGDKR